MPAVRITNTMNVLTAKMITKPTYVIAIVMMKTQNPTVNRVTTTNYSPNVLLTKISEFI